MVRVVAGVCTVECSDGENFGEIVAGNGFHVDLCAPLIRGRYLGRGVGAPRK